MSLGVNIDFFSPLPQRQWKKKLLLFSEAREIVACGILAGS